VCGCAQLKELLDEATMRFIKMFMCCPHKITSKEFRAFTPGLQPSERIHVIAIVAVARKQETLLYALRALNAFQNHR
jgi:hypothetical protein